MNIISITGGLGNQMFQYALGLTMRNRGMQVEFDISKYEYYKIHNNYELEKIFHVNDTYAPFEKIVKLGYRKDNRLSRWLQASPFRKKTIYTENEELVDMSVFQQDWKLIKGYWQSELYFMECANTVRETFQFPEIVKEDKDLYLVSEQIKNTESVGVHIRRGDYVNHPKYKGLCGKAYYESAIRFLKKQTGKELNIYIFTNDTEWVLENLRFDNMHIVDINNGENSYRDMQLMSLCKYNIIANSSFSWWGAWLNMNPNKIVVAPRKWTNDKFDYSKKIVPKGWIVL